MAERHHYVPEFHLRQFANAKKQLRMYVVGRREPIRTSVKNAAVESGFYTIRPADSSDPQQVEQWLSRVESAARGALQRVLSGHFPPSVEDRSAIALLLGLQMLRTPESRRI